jgi:hypothetical protein
MFISIVRMIKSEMLLDFNFLVLFAINYFDNFEF